MVCARLTKPLRCPSHSLGTVFCVRPGTDLSVEGASELREGAFHPDSTGTPEGRQPFPSPHPALHPGPVRPAHGSVAREGVRSYTFLEEN